MGPDPATADGTPTPDGRDLLTRPSAPTSRVSGDGNTIRGEASLGGTRILLAVSEKKSVRSALPGRHHDGGKVPPEQARLPHAVDKHDAIHELDAIRRRPWDHRLRDPPNVVSQPTK